MNTIFRKPMFSTFALILLGLISLFAGAKSLIVLIPAAMLVWFRSHPSLGRSGH